MSNLVCSRYAAITNTPKTQPPPLNTITNNTLQHQRIPTAACVTVMTVDGWGSAPAAAGTAAASAPSSTGARTIHRSTGLFPPSARTLMVCCWFVIICPNIVHVGCVDSCVKYNMHHTRHTRNTTQQPLPQLLVAILHSTRVFHWFIMFIQHMQICTAQCNVRAAGRV